MFNIINKYLYINFISLFLIFSNVYADSIKSITINGNERIPDETILMFSSININDNFNQEISNLVLKSLYQTNFFKDVNLKFIKNNLIINVVELPIIENIEYKGIKAKRIKEILFNNLNLKNRSSYNEFLLKKDKEQLVFTLRELGYYFSTVDIYVDKLDNNKVNLTYQIDLGKKAKIKKISFIGNKIYKDGKLKSLITSEEFKFWKFISGKKFLNQNMIKLDEKLLKNFYLNKGYYNVEIYSSFAKLINDDEFELVYNINANQKYYFDNLSIDLPDDFDENNFLEIKEFFEELKGKVYSLNLVNKILDKIDNITVIEEYQSITASVKEDILSDKINLEFIIKESEKFYVERINIFGNNITQESVIRNQFEIDEGDPFNEILHKKTLNNIKSLNFFKDVKADVVDSKKDNFKIINIDVDEKPTGEITAGAGFGTNGGTIMAGIRENNFLGKGLNVNTNVTLEENAIKGKFSITNPNYNNSDKAISASIQATENDKLSTFGYKTNKTGFSFGTAFEYYKDFNLGFETTSFYEKIETNSTASAAQKKQEGDYWDTFLKTKFDYDKRNQRYQTTEGFRSTYSLDLPLISESKTFTNSYAYKHYSELYENNISSISLFLKNSNSLTGDDIKLSERLYVPGNMLRGFEYGKVGPKDGDDFIGGNYLTAVNIASTLPQILPNAQNINFSLFLDAANLWGVDYDSSINDSNKIRSTIGIGVDWFTVIGPLNFTFSENISKDSSDITESFRFNIGTTF
jgi:outer membrane protein insertion porin family